MTIIDALKETETYLRNGSRTLVWDGVLRSWVVYEDVYRKGKVAIGDSQCEETAVALFLKEKSS